MVSPTFDHFKTLLNRGAYQDAIQFAEKQLINQGESDQFWLTQLSGAYTKARNPQKGFEVAQQALDSAPANRYAILARAQAAVQLERYQDALADYRELESDPRLRRRARSGILSCLDHLKAWRRILQCVGEWNVKREEVYPWTVKAYAGLGENEAAMHECQQWLTRSPDNPQALWALTELEVKRDGIEAVAARFARLAKIPSRPSTYGEIYASLSRRMGHTEVAAAQYNKLLAQSSNPRLVRKQAFALAKSGRETEAIPLMEELLRKSPRDIFLHSGYGGACHRSNELERAWNFYQELIALHPQEKTIYGWMKKIRK